MIGKRDLAFIGVVASGMALLGANLIPPASPTPLAAYHSPHHQQDDFQESLARVNAAFRDAWAEENLEPATPAADLQVARRLSLGLMGTVPSLEEIRQFEALPPGERHAWWVDHVLEDRRFADYFAERLARAAVGTEDGPFVLYRRRRFVAWLADQIAENKPYDSIVRSMIAGDGLWTDNPATNFVSVTAQQDQGNKPDPVRLAGRVTRAFLGLRLDCAQCHDHPFAKWAQDDFESLAAFFGQTSITFTGVHEGKGAFDVEDRRTREKRIVEPAVPFAQDLLPATGNRRERLAIWVTHPGNPFFARAAVNRIWAIVCGKPLVDPIDNLEAPYALPPVLDLLAKDFVDHGYDLRRLIRLIANTEVYHLDSASAHAGEAEENAWAVYPMTRLRPEQVAGSVLQASQVRTLDGQAHILVRLARYGQENEFITRYGDLGEDEFDNRGGTIPQRLLLMNGKIVRERINDGPFNTTRRIQWLSGSTANAIDTAYLAVLSRRPSPEESAYFQQALENTEFNRFHRIEDMYWALINSTEFSWNH